MMISPETYYEENLKGKTPEEIQKEIRCLKRGFHDFSFFDVI